MNLILFEKGEVSRPLAIADPRSTHILKVLKCGVGDRFDAGILNGARGKAQLLAVGNTHLKLRFTPGETPPPLLPVTVVAGLSRPQTSRHILREASSLGVRHICFVATEKGEQSYAKSRLWTKNEYLEYLKNGAQQAFCTRIPVVSLFGSLLDCLAVIPTESDRLALDNYEATMSLRQYSPASSSCVLAVGAERGWSQNERKALGDYDFKLASLGARVLRTETACIAGIIMVLSALKLI